MKQTKLELFKTPKQIMESGLIDGLSDKEIIDNIVNESSQ